METPRDRNEELAEDLRALRPTPHPDFAAELDKRAAAGFPRRSRLRWPSFDRLRAIPRRRLLLPAGALALVAIAVSTALVATNDGEKSSGEIGFLNLYSSDGDESAPTTASPEESPALEEVEPLSRTSGTLGSSRSALSFNGSGPTDAGGGPRNRAVERSAEIILGADPADVAEDASRVFEAVHAHDGIVMRSSTRQGEAGEAEAQFELRIPSAKLDDALAALSAIDEVRSRREATNDITAPTVKVGELLQDSKARIDSLLGQLADAGTESEREAVETELRQERRHRARLRSQLAQLQRRADFTLVLLRIETNEAKESSGGGTWDVDDALGDAGRILSIAAAVAVVALAVLGPFVLIGLLAWLAHQVWVRRQRRRALD